MIQAKDRLTLPAAAANEIDLSALLQPAEPAPAAPAVTSDEPAPAVPAVTSDESKPTNEPAPEAPAAEPAPEAPAAEPAPEA